MILTVGELIKNLQERCRPDDPVVAQVWTLEDVDDALLCCDLDTGSLTPEEKREVLERVDCDYDGFFDLDDVVSIVHEFVSEKEKTKTREG